MKFRQSIIVVTCLILTLLGYSFKEDKKTIMNEEDYPLLETPYSEDVQAKKIEYSSDGLKVVGFIVKPETVEGKLPLMIFNRGGNREFGKLDKNVLSTYVSYWAQRGYVVLASQYRGVDGGEGQEEFGGADVNDVLRLTDVAEELPYVDVDQKVMLGVSRGGMMTYLAIKEDMDLQAAAVVSGVADLKDSYDKREYAMKRVLEDLVGDREEDQAEYEKRSAVNWANEIDVPILIIQGAKDERVSVEQVRQLDEKLKEYDKEYKYIEYPNADHGIKSHHEASSKEIDEWFQRHLND